MSRFLFLSDGTACADQLKQQLGGLFEIRSLGFESIPGATPDGCAVIDVSLNDAAHLLDLKEWLKRKPKDAKAIFIIDKSSRIEVTRAYAIGATDVVNRPVDPKELLEKLCGGILGLAADKTFSAQAAPGVTAAVDTLQGMFGAASLGEPLVPAAIEAACGAIVGEIEAQGLSSWVDTVRRHHSQTYQHCLLVTGVAVAFGQHIGVSETDRRRLSLAGMLHDVGKARIPLAILEKPGPLDQDEMAVMRQHPQLGIDALGADSGFAPAMTDMVLHHHELLDGSGYPHGLEAGEISDLVRIMTISDIFGALIERRSYKPPLSNEAAYQILLNMGPKLDRDLIREFRFIAQFDQRQKVG